MRAVNLLPREGRARRRPSPQNLPAVVGAATGLVVVAVLCGGYLVESAKVSRAQRDLNAAKAQLAATPVPPPAPPVETTPTAVTDQVQPRLAAVSAALSQRIAWDRVLREFSAVLPNDVWLTSLSMSAPSAPGTAAAGTGSGLTISGSTYSYDSVARLLSRLSLVPDLTGVTLSSTSKVDRLVQFDVTASVKGAAAPVAAVTPVAPPTTTAVTTDTTGASS